jgi:hypothetical protein
VPTVAQPCRCKSSRTPRCRHLNDGRGHNCILTLYNSSLQFANSIFCQIPAQFFCSTARPARPLSKACRADASSRSPA